MRNPGVVLSVGLALLFVGCDFPFGVSESCPTWVVPALSVTITDSITSEPLPTALAWAREGSFVDTLSGEGGTVYGAHDRPGVYDVFVEHPSYLTWQEVGIRVEKGKCNVRTQRLEARLQSAN